MGCFYSKGYEDNGEKYDMTPIRHLPVIFVNGVPGAGNQTVAQTISNITGYTMVRPGELIREEATKDTPRGRMVADKLNAQEDIPEQLTVNLIKESMLMQQDSLGFILVGFPKNPRMSNMFNRQVKWPEKVVALEIDDEDDEDSDSDDDEIRCKYTIELDADSFPTIDKNYLVSKSLHNLQMKNLPTIKEVAATRLQNKLSELGRPDSEINSARQIVRQAACKVKSVHKRFAGHVVMVDSTGNPNALATKLKEVLADTIKTQNSIDLETNQNEPALEMTELNACPVTNPGLGDVNENSPETEIKEQEM